MSAGSIEINKFLKKQCVNITFSDLIELAILHAQSGQITIHPYGFYILKPRDNKHGQVRIHIWLDKFRTRQAPDWPPHNHNSDIDSIVIEGELVHHVWEVENSITSNNVLYEVSYGTTQSKLTKTKQFLNCIKASTECYRLCDTYHLPRYIFHSVDVDANKTAITVCITTNHGDSSPYVVGGIDGEFSYEYSRRNLSSTEQALVIQKLIDLRYKE